MELSSIVKGFINELNSLGRSPSTVIAYKKDIEQLIEFFNSNNLGFENAETNDIQDFLDDLAATGRYTAKTISRKINTLKTLYKYLFSKGYTKEDYAAPIKHPEIKSNPPKFLTQIEYKALRDTVKNNIRLYTMIELLLQTGMRIGELSRLKLEDITQKGKSTIINISAFASNPSRSIEANDIAANALEKWINERGNVRNDEGYLFPTKSGKAVLVRNIRTSINRAFKKVGIKDATVNDIRNTFILYQLEKGVKPEKIAQTVGHQRLSSTEKYLEMLDIQPKSSVNKIIPL